MRLVILGGNPGSGKTHISTELEKHGFTCLAIDDFYQRAPRTPGIERWYEDKAFLDHAYAAFREAISDGIGAGKSIAIETTGVGNRWKSLLAELESIFKDQIVKIYLETTRETASQRIQARNETDYPIKMTEERLDTFFKLGQDTSSGYDHVVNANRSPDEVLKDVLEYVK
jgi:adenylate kinase family enzyme